MKNSFKTITHLAVLYIIILLSISSIAFCDTTPILLDQNGIKYETYSAKGTLESTKTESSRWTINDKDVYNKDKSTKTNFDIERNEAGKYKSKYTKKETSNKEILGVNQKKYKKEDEIQWGKGNYRAETYFEDEKGVLRNGLGEKANDKEKKAYEKATKPSVKNKIKDKIKDNTSIKIDEKTYWDEEDALVKKEKKFKDVLGTDADVSVKSEVLGYSTSAKRQIECKGGDCGVEYSANAEVVVVRVDGEIETKFFEEGPLAIESKTTGTLEVSAEAKAKGEAKIGKDGVKLEGGAEVFAGGRAKVGQEFKTDFLGLGLKLNLDGQVSYGAGVEAKGNFDVSWTKIKLGGKLAATLGLGAGGGVGIEVDISKWTTPVRDVISDVSDFFWGKDEDDEKEKPIQKEDENNAGTLLKPSPIQKEDENSAGTPLKPIKPLPKPKKLHPVKPLPNPQKLPAVKPLPKPQPIPW
ncbi:hypothetical protein QUF75_10780 [Desulfococcaceae bacterium HSG7]|nr:hypothetical protein [Desulfococcaceae bacterium HSG7]